MKSIKQSSNNQIKLYVNFLLEKYLCTNCNKRFCRVNVGNNFYSKYFYGKPKDLSSFVLVGDCPIGYLKARNLSDPTDYSTSNMLVNFSYAKNYSYFKKASQYALVSLICDCGNFKYIMMPFKYINNMREYEEYINRKYCVGIKI